MKVYFGEIYEHIGYLLYAVAAEEQKLSAKDVAKLKQLIHKAWHEDQPIRNSNLEDLTQHFFSAIDHAVADSLTGEEALDIFEKYYFLHHLAFGSVLRGRIATVSDLISREFSIRNTAARLFHQAKHLLANYQHAPC